MPPFDLEKLKERARKKQIHKSSLSLKDVKYALNPAAFKSYQRMMKPWRRSYDMQSSWNTLTKWLIVTQPLCTASQRQRKRSLSEQMFFPLGWGQSTILNGSSRIIRQTTTLSNLEHLAARARS